MKTFGTRLNEVIELRKMKQAELLDKLGKSGKSVVSNWINGVAKPQADDLAKLSQILDVSVDYLLLGKETSSAKPIPFYEDIPVWMGQTNYFQENHETPTAWLSIPWLQDCDAAFPATGNSMYPRLQPGEVVLCKYFPSWREYVPYGEIFVIITKAFRTVKYIKKASKATHYLLVPENLEEHEPFEVPISEILNILIVKGSIKQNLI